MNREHEKILFEQILKLVKRTDKLLNKVEGMQRELNEVSTYVKGLEILSENTQDVTVKKNVKFNESKSPLFEILNTVQPIDEGDGEKSILDGGGGIQPTSDEAQKVLDKIQGMFKG